MENIKLVQIGLNGSADFSIFDSKGNKIVTKKGIKAIAEEMKKLYPENSKAMNVVYGSLEDVKEVDLFTLSRDARYEFKKEFKPQNL